MTHSPRRARMLALGAATTAVGIIAVSGAASAHVSIGESEVTAGSYEILTFGLPHGCGESPTTELRIQIPEETVAITPTRNALWEVEKVMEELEEPITGPHGESYTERVAEVVYTANSPLPNGYRDVFELSLRIPEETAGTTLYFPTIQTCDEGETAWIEIPAEGEDPHALDEPSPYVAVVAADAGDGHGSSEADEASDDADEAAAGGVSGASAETATGEAAATSSGGDDGDDGASTTLAVIALIIGALGLGAGGLALFRSRPADRA